MKQKKNSQHWQQDEPAKIIPLTEEERGRFLAIWEKKMPQVLTWSDSEIRYGMFVGM